MPKSKIEYSDDIRTPEMAVKAILHLYPYQSKYEISQRQGLVPYILDHGTAMDAASLVHTVFYDSLSCGIPLYQVKEAIAKILTLKSYYVMRALQKLPAHKRLVEERMQLLKRATAHVSCRKWLDYLKSSVPNKHNRSEEWVPFFESEWKYLVELVLRQQNPAIAVHLINLTRSSDCLSPFERSVEIATLEDFIRRRGGNTEDIKPPKSSGGFT